MSKDSEISATEKLLEMIRGEEEEKRSSPSVDISFDIEMPVVQDNSPDPALDNLSVESDNRQSTTSLKKSFPENRSAEAPPKDTNIPDKQVDDQDDDEPIQVHPPLSQYQPTVKEKKSLLSSFSTLFSTIKIISKVQVGIDIQADTINFAKLNNSAPTPTLNNYLAVLIPAAELGQESVEDLFRRQDFIETISHNLSMFCGDLQKPDIWCSFQSENIQVHSITIPKVPQNEIANAVFWTTKKEFDFDPVDFIYDFSIIKEIDDGDIKKIITVVYLFPRKEVEAVSDLFKRIGYPLTGITHSSSAINNCLRSNVLDSGEAPCAHIYFEKLSSHIDIYSQGSMLFTREIKTGMDSYTESVFDLAADEDLILDDQSAIAVVFDHTKELLTHPPADAEEEIEEISSLLDLKQLSATGRLTRQLNRTFDFCSANFRVPRATKIYNSGPLTLKDEITKEIAAEVGVPCEVVDIFESDLEGKSYKGPLANFPGPLSPLTSFGLALSNSAITQNILCTFADKRKLQQENRVNQIISCVTIILALTIGTLFFFQYQSVDKKQQIFAALNSQLEERYLAEPRSRDTNFALMATKKISETVQETKDKAQRFTIIALVKEATNQVTDEIKLTYLRIEANSQNTSTEQSNSNAPQKQMTMIMRGFVSGNESEQNFNLLDFQKRLKQLQLVDRINISSRETISYNNTRLIYFTFNIILAKDLS